MAEVEELWRAIRSVRPGDVERLEEKVGPEERRQVFERIVGWSGPLPTRLERVRPRARRFAGHRSGAREGAPRNRRERLAAVESLSSPELAEPVEGAHRRHRGVVAVAFGTAAALVAGVVGVVALRDEGRGSRGESVEATAVAALSAADVAALRAAFEEMVHQMFDGSAGGGDPELSMVVGADRLREFVEPLFHENASTYERLRAEVVDVAATGPDRATVSFRVFLDGQPYSFPIGTDDPQPAELTLEAVKVDGAWKYTVESMCEMLATFGFPCPPEVADQSYQDVAATPEGREVAAVVERFLDPSRSIDEQVALVEDGEHLRGPIEGTAAGIRGYDVVTRVDEVLVSPERSRALVRFSLALDGVPILRVSGDTVRGPQGWQLGHRTACELVESIWSPVPAVVDCAPAPGSPWADEPAPKVATADDPVEPEVEAAVRSVLAGLLDETVDASDLALVDRTSFSSEETLDDEAAREVLEAFASAIAKAPVEIGAVTPRGATFELDGQLASEPLLRVSVDLTGGAGDAPAGITFWRSSGTSWKVSLWRVCLATHLLGGECRGAARVAWSPEETGIRKVDDGAP